MKSREKKRRKTAPTAAGRNGKLFLLLTAVPEFQKDVADLRKRFRIPPRGYITDHEKNPRYEYDRKDQERADRDADKKLDELGTFYSRPFSPEFDAARTKNKPFEAEIRRIGEKFRLPYNLYSDSICGLAWYVVRGLITVVERNWDLDTDIRHDERALPVRWAVIRAYLPLDEMEATEAINELNTALRDALPAALGKRRRLKEDPAKYLDQIALMLEQEDLPAGDRIPKSDRERALLKRADQLAMELFGYGLRVNSKDAA